MGYFGDVKSRNYPVLGRKCHEVSERRAATMELARFALRLG
jgi:hypothetical protein